MRLFRRKKPHPLDEVLFLWDDLTPFTVRDMLRSCQCKGISGSGKTSGTYMHFLRALLAHPRSTMFFITQKPEERQMVVEEYKRAGRLEDLIIIDHEGRNRCNFLEDELESGADTRSLTDFTNILGEGQSQGDGENRFYRKLEERAIYNAIGSLQLGGKVSFPAMQAFIVDAVPPRPTADIETSRLAVARWKEGYHYRVMCAAEQRHKTSIQTNDWNVFNSFWAKEWPAQDERTRGNALAGILSTLHAANTGLARELTSTTTNVSPRMIDQGKSIMVDLPFSIHGPTGRYVAGGWKYKLQKHILRRPWNPSDFFNVMILDEFQETVTPEQDASYLAQCRSHGGCMLPLTQTVHGEYGRAGSHSGHHKVDQLRSNFGLHIYHLVDPDTAKGASELLGQRRETFISTTIPGGDDPWDVFMGQAKASVSVSETYTPVLQPSVLMSRLRTGGPENNNCVDAVIVRPGQPFKSGQNYLFQTFKQG